MWKSGLEVLLNNTPVKARSKVKSTQWGPNEGLNSRHCQSQLGEPMSFIGVVYRGMGEWLLAGAEMTQR